MHEIFKVVMLYCCGVIRVCLIATSALQHLLAPQKWVILQ